LARFVDENYYSPAASNFETPIFPLLSLSRNTLRYMERARSDICSAARYGSGPRPYESGEGVYAVVDLDEKYLLPRN